MIGLSGSCRQLAFEIVENNYIFVLGATFGIELTFGDASRKPLQSDETELNRG